MANKKHLAILKQGVVAWNEWRENHPEIKVDLQGLSFKGKDLTGANFTEADIRGANFTNATLRDANFSGAKAGLQLRWAMGLVLSSWVLAGLSGVFAGSTAYLVSLIFDSNIENFIAGVVSVVLIAVFFVITIRKGLGAGFAAIAIPVAVSVVGAFAFTLAGALGIAAAVAGALAVASALAIVVAVAAAVASALAIVVAVAAAVASAGSVARLAAGVVAGAVPVAGTLTVAVAGTFTVTFMLLSAYIGWCTIAGDENHAWIRGITIALAATGGTSFSKADLTDADFTKAALKSTDFRDAILTRTCWHQVKRLNRARPGTTYLENAQLQQLLVTGQGQGKTFDSLDLRRLNLSGANLANASLIGTDFYQASLQEADLSGALLVRTQLEQTDLTGANLTGACIEDWVVTRTTKLYGVLCKYIFMRFRDGNKRDQLPLKGEFKDGEFILFVRSVLDTLELYHERDVNPRAAVIVLNSLAEKYQEPLEIVGVEKQENGIILKVKTSEWANQEQIKEAYYSEYSQVSLSLPLKDFGKLLPPYEGLEARLTEFVEEVKNRPTTNIEYLYNKGFVITGGSVNMTDQSRNINISGGTVNNSGAGAMSLGDISGTVANTINQLPASTEPDKPGIKELLEELKAAIEAESNLSEEDKTEALEQVQALAEAGKAPEEGDKQKAAKKATTMLKGIIAGLPEVAKLAVEYAKLLPMITGFFGLV
jgi:uncharacterized protein YjbI with pentapeptide repeats